LSVPLTVNGAVFNYPVNFDTNWGIDATGWAQAVTAGMLQKSGGTFPLTADVNFGASFGLVASYFTSHAANPSTAGTLRLASIDPGIGFRNNANSGNLILTTNSSDNLIYPGGLELSSTLILHNQSFLLFQDTGSAHSISMHAPTVTTNYGFTLPPNSGANGQVLQTDGTGITTWVNVAGSGTVNSGAANNLALYPASGNTVGDTATISAHAVTVALNGSMNGVRNFIIADPVTSAGLATPSFLFNTYTNQPTITTPGILLVDPSNGQAGISLSANGNINSRIARIVASPSIAASTTRTYTLPEAGADATIILNTGSPTFIAPVAMTANKITGLANGTVAQDAVAFGQVQYAFQSAVQTTTTATTPINSASYLVTSITATITPTSSSNRIKITTTIAGVDTITPNTNVTIFRNGSVDLGAPSLGFFKSFDSGTVPLTITFIDSPNTISATTYTVYARNSSSSASINPAGATCVMILEELR
jgi:hypothetical protein